MSFVVRSLPPERDDDTPAVPPARFEEIEAERARLIAGVRRGCRSERQRALLRKLAELTRESLAASVRDEGA